MPISAGLSIATRLYPHKIGQAYYVDATGGNDANHGRSPAAPWQTMGKVNGETFLPGDRILFKRGETWTGTALTVPSSGVSGKPIIFGAYSTGAAPIIDGNDTVNCVVAANKSCLRFENLDIAQGVDFGFTFTTCDNVALVGCDAHDCGNDQVIFITTCYDCSVTGGSFYNGYQRVGGTIASGLEIADGSHDIVFRGVTCHSQTGGPGITVHSHALTTMPYNIQIVDATCYSNSTHGINVLKQDDTADTPRNITLSSCLTRDNTQEGVRIETTGANYLNGVTFNNCISRDNTRYAVYIVADNVAFRECLIQEGRMLRIWDGQDISIINCTFYLTTWGSYRPIDVFTSAARTQNITAKNNIVASADTATYHIGFAAGAVTGADVDYNLYYSGAALGLTRWRWAGVNVNWANWLTNSSQDANSPTPADPLFTDVASDNFTLQAGSPARGAGIDMGFGTDIGAFQFGS